MRPRLFLRVIGMEVRRAMMYRGDFWVTTVFAFLIQIAILYYFWLAIYTESNVTEIAGYTMPMLVCHYVFVTLFAGIVRSIETERFLADDIYAGTITPYLLYPCRYLPFMYAKQLGALLPALLQLVIFGMIAPWWLGIGDALHYDLGSLTMLTVVLFAANFTYFHFLAAVQAAAFWHEQVRSLSAMVRFASNLLGGLLLPLSMFPERVRDLLYYTPFPYLFDAPVRILLGTYSFEEFLRGLVIVSIWALAVNSVVRWVWTRGLRTYAGVGI